MVTTSLVTEPDRATAKLVEYLDDHGFPLDAVFWMLDPESEIWHLYLASSVVARYGPRRAYQLAREALVNTEVEIPLAQIKVIEPSSPLLRNLRSAITVSTLSWVPFRNNTVNGTFIKDAVLLRV